VAGIEPLGAEGVPDLPQGTVELAQESIIGVEEAGAEEREDLPGTGQIGVAQSLMQGEEGLERMHMGILPARQLAPIALRPATAGSGQSAVDEADRLVDPRPNLRVARGSREPGEGMQHERMVVEVPAVVDDVARGRQSVDPTRTSVRRPGRAAQARERALRQRQRRRARRKSEAGGVREDVDLACLGADPQLFKGERATAEVELLPKEAGRRIGPMFEPEGERPIAHPRKVALEHVGVSVRCPRYQAGGDWPAS
jgi:hypothetical protein